MGLSDTWLRGVSPPPQISVSDYADAHRWLPAESAEPGAWRTARTPWIREIQDAMGPLHPAREIVVMKRAQSAGSEAIINVIMYTTLLAPGSGLVIQPTEEVARRWSKRRLSAAIDAFPAWRDLFGDSKRNEHNSYTYKSFPGGSWRVGWGNSAAQLRGDPHRYVILDDLDAYPADVEGEGSPVELARARTHSYGARGKVILVSTPTIEGHSAIEAAYLEGDQREWHVPCDACGALMIADIELLQLRGDEVLVVCPHCGHGHSDARHAALHAAGEWIATQPGTGLRLSYHVGALCYPAGWSSYGELLSRVVHAEASGDQRVIRAVHNTVLGRPYRSHTASGIDYRPLWARAGGYERGEVPPGVCVLTAGADVQADRVEVEIVGWGAELRSWSIDYVVLYGDPALPAVWEALSEVLRRDYGGLSIRRLAIDTGYLPQEVYAWAAQHGPDRVQPTKGSSAQSGKLIASVSQQDVLRDGRKTGAVTLWVIGVSQIKHQLARWLQLDDPTSPRWCAFPSGYDEDHYRGLCGEEYRVSSSGKAAWHKVVPRQEAWDCRVYAVSAAITLGLDRWSTSEWDAAAQRRQRPDRVVSRRAVSSDWLG